MDIDTALNRLSHEPAPAELARRRAAVLQVASASPVSAAGESYGLNLLLVGVALGMGIAGGMMLPAAGGHPSDYAALTGVDHLAPSALLAGA